MCYVKNENVSPEIDELQSNMQLGVVKQELNDVCYVMLFMLYSIRYSLGNEEVFFN